ncbi:hypothetical protein CEXT_91191 [Caerostris extrusa]|uniref:Uncharacterized protein n=1 Tax=Caerostris extrusa TaxID=172846 RepID=A0AAV4SD04_CAEEX|nr:hypothetical protein CEXT_91191 [Caerostris extrusa]
MNSLGLSFTAVLLLLGVASALPNELMSALKHMPDLTQPENTMMGQSLKEMGVEICRTNCTCVRQPPTAARRKTESGTAVQRLLLMHPTTYS